MSTGKRQYLYCFTSTRQKPPERIRIHPVERSTGKCGLIPEIYDNTEKAISYPEGISRDKKPLILVVEDNRDIRMQLADNFNREYAIMEAIDGVSGLKKAIELIPDLVITDLMMPQMDGIELCEKLKMMNVPAISRSSCSLPKLPWRIR